MKVGILTLHNAINYGATLQALALQQYIDSLGVNVEIIDYRNKHIDEKYWKSDNYLYPIKIILKGHIRRGEIFLKILRILLIFVKFQKIELCKSI